MSDDQRTGALVKALADGVREDLADIAADLEAIRMKVERLGEDARAINGLGNDCAGWASHITTIVGEVKKEQQEIPAKLLGQPLREITQSVNVELATEVQKQRRSA